MNSRSRFGLRVCTLLIASAGDALRTKGFLACVLWAGFRASNVLVGVACLAAAAPEWERAFLPCRAVVFFLGRPAPFGGFFDFTLIAIVPTFLVQCRIATIVKSQVCWPAPLARSRGSARRERGADCDCHPTATQTHRPTPARSAPSRTCAP